jgi:hypothetical protein
MEQLGNTVCLNSDAVKTHLAKKLLPITCFSSSVNLIVTEDEVIYFLTIVMLSVCSMETLFLKLLPLWSLLTYTIVLLNMTKAGSSIYVRKTKARYKWEQWDSTRITILYASV